MDLQVRTPFEIRDDESDAAGFEGQRRPTTSSSSLSPAGRGGGVGREFHFGGTHLAAMKNGVIQEETEDESMGEQGLLSTGDEGELKSCR